MTAPDAVSGPGRVRFGISAYDVSVSRLVDVAQAAEAAGFEHLWLGEHLIDPGYYASKHPAGTKGGADAGGLSPGDFRTRRIVEASTQLVDPLVALAAVGARTSRIRLATGIYLLALRHPLVTARAAATLQEVSGGRFMLGVGAGWLREEFSALGVPFAERASRVEESVAILRKAWRGGRFDYRGRHFCFEDVQVCPEPVNVPLVTGGNSPGALRRAARIADGWFSSATPTFEEAVELRDALAAHCRAEGTDVECHVRVRHPTPEVVGRYVEAGFKSLVFWAQDVSPPGADTYEQFRKVARSLGIPSPDLTRQ